MNDIAYNAGLEIRYAIAASGIDPIQHIPEVDAIIERRLAEARRQAFIEASEIAEAQITVADEDEEPGGDEWFARGAANNQAMRIAAALRRAAEV